MKTDKLVEYVLSFLLGVETLDGLTSLVGYTRDPEAMAGYRVVIQPSGFFDMGVYAHPEAYPSLPLATWEGIPLLFGTPRVERLEDSGTLVVYADIIASTYFLVSRYEEMFFRGERDQYGRFLGQQSLAVRAGFIHRPIVDEYGVALRALLRSEGIELAEPERRFSKINLTHDIDSPYQYHGIRSFMRALIREKKSFLESYRLAFQSLGKDKYFTFSRFLEWNRELEQRLPSKCSTIFFYKTPGTEPEDRPNYRIGYGAVSKVHEYALKYGVKEEIHLPLECSKYPDRIRKHVNLLSRDLGRRVSKSRHHFLACREPEDFLFLAEAGILDDYTMGYPDVAGFRLGTCRPVRFILPSTGSITPLTLHPLTLMDCTLDRPQYMGLGAKDALAYAHQLVLQTARYGGELNLLFHNNLLSKEVHPFHSRLYSELLRTVLRIELDKTNDPLEKIAPCPEEF